MRILTSTSIPVPSPNLPYAYSKAPFDFHRIPQPPLTPVHSSHSLDVMVRGVSMGEGKVKGELKGSGEKVKTSTVNQVQAAEAAGLFRTTH